MKNKATLDMTEGSILKLLGQFTLPMLAGNIFQQFYNLVDSIIVGRYVGDEAFGAVGSVGSLVFLFFSLCFGLASGIGILVSQYFGAKQEDNVKKCIANAVYITLGIGVIVSIIGAGFAEPILHMMKTPEKNFHYALTYMRLVCGFTVIPAIYNAISAILRSLGDSKTPLIFLIVASFVNIFLDLLFVIAFNWGVAGVALATIISQTVSALGSIIYGVRKNPYLHLSGRYFKPDKDILKKEIRMGLPLAAQNATIAVSCVALQSVVNKFGPVEMAAYTATSRVESLVQQPYGTLGVALSTLSGQNFGAGKKDRITKGAVTGVALAAVFSLLMVVVMHLFGRGIVNIFIEKEAVIDLGARGLRITSYMYFFLGLIYVMRGLLNGVGDVTFSMMNGFSEVICRIGFAWLLVSYTNIGNMAAWYTNGLTWTLVGIMSVWRFALGKWKTKVAFESAVESGT